MDTKQIIVIRKDLNMRKGKAISQGSHASMAFLTKNCVISGVVLHTLGDGEHTSYKGRFEIQSIDFAVEIKHWLDHSFKKIVVYVNSEAELDELHQKALDKGLVSHMIIDNGATEFKGVPTKTAIAIGPHISSKFDGLTDHLPLL